MQTKATQLFWSQTQCHLESVLLLNTFFMDQAGFQIGADGSSFDSLLLLKPRFDWVRAESYSISLKTSLRYWKSTNFSLECR